MPLEVCVEDVSGARAAEEGGAQRIELCAALSEGGLTPSIGLVREVRAAVGLEIVVLVRPRRGDFLYTPAEQRVVLADVEALTREGIEGVAVGALASDGGIDAERTRELVQAARGLVVTFHRAFDLARDPLEALEVLRALGVGRILTSGQAPTALAGAPLLARLVERAGSELAIVAAGGVRPENALELMHSSGVRELHSSAGTLLASEMTHRRAGLSLGGSAPPDEYTRRATDPAVVRALAQLLAE